MAIEVELKARVRDRDATLQQLAQHDQVEACVHRDTYFDWPDGRLEQEGRQELRVRIIERNDDSQVVLTYKGTMLDPASQIEHETPVEDAASLKAILSGLGLEPAIVFEKHCLNYRLHAEGRKVTLTVVQVPELGNETFIEVETLVNDADDIPDATGTIRAVLADLGFADDDLTDELYTHAVRRHRTQAP